MTDDAINSAFRNLGPAYSEPREVQAELLRQLEADRPALAFLEAPTGIGKSGIAVAHGELIDSKMTAILTATISLQQQYERDFDEMLLLKGRGNFDCMANGLSAAEGECTVVKGATCGSDYYEMRDQLRDARRVVANYSIYLFELFYVQSLMGRRSSHFKPDLLICDEAHRLLDLLTAFETKKLDAELAEALGIDVPGHGWVDQASAMNWCADHHDHVKEMVIEAVVQGDKRARKWKALQHQMDDISMSSNQLLTLTTGKLLTLSPLWPHRAARKLVDSAHSTVLMSATMYGGHLLAELLGLAGQVGQESDAVERGYQFYTVPSPFDPERWPVYYRPVAKLSKRADESAWVAVAEEIHHYVHLYRAVKGVIHVTAANQIDRLSAGVRGCDQCRDRLLIPDKRGRGSRADLLARFRGSDAGTWLIHYSVGEGEDFKDDQCRIQLIAKVPYPDLGDPLTRLRSEEPGLGRKMYSGMTLARIAQTAGRLMRHKSDHGETIILDGNFGRLWSWSGSLAPSWFPAILKMER